MERFPSWSADGARFLYMVGGLGRSDALWTGRAEGNEAIVVLRLAFSGFTSAYRYSPDGRRIAWVDPSGIQTAPSAGGQPVRVLASREVSSGLCWSADGEWIWYRQKAMFGKLPSQGGSPVTVKEGAGTVLDCSPDGRWIAYRGSDGVHLMSPDGTGDRQIASYSEYASFSDFNGQFGEGGRVFYLLRLDRRTIDMLDTATGRPLRSLRFEIPAADQIQGFSFKPDGSRVLLTTGGQRYDLWLAEGFAQPASGWRSWFRHWEPPAAPPQ
jgi:Tol biopolymer transport system component